MFHAYTVDAQYVLKRDDNGYYIPRVALKYSPMHLIGFYPSAQFGLEHKVFRKTTLQYEVGWIFNVRGNNSEEYANKRGHRIIGELRQYLPFTRRVPFYLAAEWYYHKVMFDRNRVIGHYNGKASDGYSYYQYINYKVRAEQNGGGIKFGMLLYPGRENHTFFIDINSGLAVRDIRYTNLDMPAGDYNLFGAQDDYPLTPSEKNRVELRPVLGIRVGFKIL